MDLPFVSIVIPTYSREEHLRKCLLSLAGQTYPQNKFEVIVIDDGSTDNTEAMIGELLHCVRHQLKYFTQENQGVTNARNRGIKESSGSIIGFTSDDVTADPLWIDNAVKHFSNPDVGGVEGIIVATEKMNITPFTHYTESLTPRRFMTANIFYRKSILEGIAGFDKRFSLHIREDTDIALTVLEKGYQIEFDDKVVIKHPAYMSEHWKIFKEAKNGYVEPLLYKKHKKSMNDYKKYNLERRTLIAIPYFYYGYYLAVPLLLLSIIFKLDILFPVAAFSISHIITLYARLRSKKISIKDFIVMNLIYLVIPYGRLYYIFLGCLKFRSFIFL